MLADVFHGVVGVLHNIVQQGCRNGFIAKANVVHHNLRYGNGVQHIRLPAAAAHIAVGAVRKLEGALHHFQLRRIGAAFFCRCTQLGIGLVNDLVIFFVELRKTHIVKLLIN